MTRSQLAAKLAASCGITRVEAECRLEAVCDEIRRALAMEAAVKLPGFGTFKAKDKPARVARNPRTGGTVAVPAQRRVSFTFNGALPAWSAAHP